MEKKKAEGGKARHHEKENVKAKGKEKEKGAEEVKHADKPTHKGEATEATTFKTLALLDSIIADLAAHVGEKP